MLGPRDIIEYYRHFMDQDKLDHMDLSKLIVADEQARKNDS